MPRLDLQAEEGKVAALLQFEVQFEVFFSAVTSLLSLLRVKKAPGTFLFAGKVLLLLHT